MNTELAKKLLADIAGMREELIALAEQTDMQDSAVLEKSRALDRLLDAYAAVEKP